MKIIEIKPEQSGGGGFAPESGRRARRPRNFGINKYGFAGFGYASLGMVEAFTFATVPGDLSVAAIEAAVIGVIVSAPAALLTFRQGVVSAGALALLAGVNAVGSGFAAANGDPYFTIGSVVVNLGFLASFMRGGFIALAARRENRFA